MNSELMICKLTEKSIQIGAVHGGLAEIAMCDIAAALAYSYEYNGHRYKLSPAAYDYARAVILMDGSKHKAIRLRLLATANRLAREQKWKVNWSKQQLEKLADAVSTEIIHPKTSYCRRCSGSGKTIDNYRATHVCDKCEGSGRRNIPDQELADKLGVCQQAVSKTWRSRYKQLHNTAMILEDAVKAHLYYQFN